MARRIFFSFHYENDVNRAMIVRNSWVVQGVKEANFIDKAKFESVKREGDNAVHNWIDRQLNGTSVTIVLIGAETLSRPFVQYKICESLKRGNGIIGVHINNINDMSRGTAPKSNTHTSIGRYKDGSSAYFDAVADAIYDYTLNDGYHNMGKWIESSAQLHGK